MKLREFLKEVRKLDHLWHMPKTTMDGKALRTQWRMLCPLEALADEHGIEDPGPGLDISEARTDRLGRLLGLTQKDTRRIVKAADEMGEGWLRLRMVWALRGRFVRHAG